MKFPNHIPANSCKPEIAYPCIWQYKVIGSDRAALGGAIAACVQEQSHSLADSKVSSGGKYISLCLEVMVADEEDRLRISRTLAEHPAVKVVL